MPGTLGIGIFYTQIATAARQYQAAVTVTVKTPRGRRPTASGTPLGFDGLRYAGLSPPLIRLANQAAGVLVQPADVDWAEGPRPLGPIKLPGLDSNYQRGG